MSKFGKSAIGWSSTEDSNTERIHLLDTPLREMYSGHTLSNYHADSLDKSVRETFYVGTGAYELVGKVRYDANAASLIDVIKAGSQGKTLTYYPNLSDPDVSYACLLIAPNSPADLQLDSQRGVFGEQQVEIRLRKTDKTAWPALPKGTNVLFSYRAGDSLAAAIFARADTASYVAKGLGTLTTAASGAARITWLSTVGSSGVRNVPALLLERSQTNRVTWSEKLSTWSDDGSPTISSGQSDPRGGTNAWLLSDNSTSQFQGKVLNITLTSATRWGYSVFLRQGTTISGGVSFKVRDISSGTDKGSMTVTWSSGKPTVTIVTGSSWESPQAYRGGWWRVSGRTSTSISTGHTNQIQIHPASLASRGNVYFFGAQVE